MYDIILLTISLTFEILFVTHLTLSSAAATDFAFKSLTPAPYEIDEVESILESFRAKSPTVFSIPFVTFGRFLELFL